MEESVMYIREKILSLKKVSHHKDSLRYELYTLFTVIILSTELFKRNKDIKEFLNKFDFELKDYIFSNRTNIISHVIRRLQKADVDKLISYLEILEKAYYKLDSKDEADSKEAKNSSNNNANYFDDMLKKYSRNR